MKICRKYIFICLICNTLDKEGRNRSTGGLSQWLRYVALKWQSFLNRIVQSKSTSEIFQISRDPRV